MDSEGFGLLGRGSNACAVLLVKVVATESKELFKKGFHCGLRDRRIARYVVVGGAVA